MANKKEKTPRVSGNPYKGAGKKPKSASGPTPSIRIPKTAETDGASSSDRKVRFRFGSIDHDSEWSILDISREDHKSLLKFLSEIESMTAGELFKPGQRLCKVYQDMSKCPNNKVKERLASHFDGLDHMVRLELTGLKRLYGVRAGHEFHIVWWDPRHEVWPSTLKNT